MWQCCHRLWCINTIDGSFILSHRTASLLLHFNTTASQSMAFIIAILLYSVYSLRHNSLNHWDAGEASMSQSLGRSYSTVSWWHYYVGKVYHSLFLDGWRNQNGWIFGKITNSLWPPALYFRKITMQFFFRRALSKALYNYKGPKSAMKFFGLKMTPPPLVQRHNIASFFNLFTGSQFSPSLV